YRHAAFDPETSLAIFMSQSGETADTLAALEEAKRRGVPTLGIVNAVGSTLARSVSHGGIYLHAGTEVSVASTKAYSSMVVALLMLGGFFADRRGQRLGDIRTLAEDLIDLPNEIELVLKLSDQIKAVADKLAEFKHAFVLGRGNLFPIALEGALKITEVSYIHAQAFPTGEMKHGPISLVDENHLSIVLLPEDRLLYDKSVNGVMELKARGGKVLTVSSKPQIEHSDWHINVPMVGPRVSGLVMNCCLQLLALHLAERLGRNTDRPRNLAKSVTVE
ncbi:MAG: SIS domain-containing protein, partial [Acidimicrobiia bacterium]|nr:SIS domain-containing protein [Acidimicrobiia bacterium]